MATEERLDPVKTKKLRSLLWHTQRYVWAAGLAHGRTLDAACGTGYGTVLLGGSSSVKSVLGIDIDPQVIELCKKRYGQHTPKVEFQVADVMLVRGGQTIVSFETIEHIEDPHRFLRRVHCVLDPEGQLLASVPIDERKDQNPYHLHHFSKADFHRLLHSAGFRITDEWLQDEPASKEVTKVLVVRAVKL